MNVDPDGDTDGDTDGNEVDRSRAGARRVIDLGRALGADAARRTPLITHT